MGNPAAGAAEIPRAVVKRGEKKEKAGRRTRIASRLSLVEGVDTLDAPYKLFIPTLPQNFFFQIA